MAFAIFCVALALSIDVGGSEFPSISNIVWPCLYFIFYDMITLFWGK